MKPWLEVMRQGQMRKGRGVVGQIFKPAVYRFSDPHSSTTRSNDVVYARIARWYRQNEKSNL